jgi:hypothetical protein
VTAAEISSQIAKASAAFSNSPLMSAAREGLEQAQAASGRLMSTPEFQQVMAGVERRRREEAQLEEARRLEEATLALDRARRSRLRRLFITWSHRQDEVMAAEEWTQASGGYGARVPGPPGTGWLASELGLAAYLQDAHLHPAIARPKPGGVREWFEDWRVLALAALHEGLSAGDVATIALATPRPQEALTRLPVPVAARPAFDWMRERFAALARPNAPGRTRLYPSPQTGGELAAIGA